jgi:hypothetical protein
MPGAAYRLGRGATRRFFQQIQRMGRKRPGEALGAAQRAYFKDEIQIA